MFSTIEFKIALIQKYIKDLNRHIKELEIKKRSFSEQKEFYDYIIDNFVEYLDNHDSIIYEKYKDDEERKKIDVYSMFEDNNRNKLDELKKNIKKHKKILKIWLKFKNKY